MTDVEDLVAQNHAVVHDTIFRILSEHFLTYEKAEGQEDTQFMFGVAATHEAWIALQATLWAVKRSGAVCGVFTNSLPDAIEHPMEQILYVIDVDDAPKFLVQLTMAFAESAGTFKMNRNIMDSKLIAHHSGWLGAGFGKLLVTTLLIYVTSNFYDVLPTWTTVLLVLVILRGVYSGGSSIFEHGPKTWRLVFKGRS